MIDKIFSIVTKSANKSDDDFADRLNYRFTSGLLAMGAFLITWYTAFGDVIQCWTPTYFAGAWIDYTNNLCFIKDTYYLPMTVPIEKGRDENMDYKITYYQWIPLFFMWLAMCFYLPRAIWYNVFSHHFVDINAIVDLLTSFDNAVNPETRDPAVSQVARHIDRYLSNCTEYRHALPFAARKQVTKSRTFLLYFGRRYGLAITLIYLAIKSLYIVIAAVQLYWIDTFLRGTTTQLSFRDYYQDIFTSSYVLKVIRSLYNGTSWEDSPTFPRVTMCDFEARALGQNEKFSIQCVLPINLFNEKIFLFLWCWILLVLCITTVNLCLWVWRITFQCNREKYIVKHLTLMNQVNHPDAKFPPKVTKRLIHRFIHDYLRPDGVFLVRLIAINTNCLIASEITSQIWEAFLEHPKVQHKAQAYTDHYLAKYPADSLADIGSGVGTEEYYAPNPNNSSLVIKKRSTKQFSVFQPQAAATQPPDDSTMSNEKSLDKSRGGQGRRRGQPRRNNQHHQKVDFEAEPEYADRAPATPGKRSLLERYVRRPCVAAEDVVGRVKDLLHSDTELSPSSDLSDVDTEGIMERPKQRRRPRKLFTCLDMPSESEPEDGGAAWATSLLPPAQQHDSSANQEHDMPTFTPPLPPAYSPSAAPAAARAGGTFA